METKWLHTKNKRKPKMIKKCPICGETMYYITPNTMVHFIISTGSIQNIILEIDDPNEDLEATCFECEIYFNPITGEIQK